MDLVIFDLSAVRDRDTKPYNQIQKRKTTQHISNSAAINAA
jgi:hypothetical protein